MCPEDASSGFIFTICKSRLPGVERNQPVAESVPTERVESKGEAQKAWPVQVLLQVCRNHQDKIKIIGHGCAETFCCDAGNQNARVESAHLYIVVINCVYLLLIIYMLLDSS
jgi:hypothetical protein